MESIKDLVQVGYARAAQKRSSCCGAVSEDVANHAINIGYDEAQVDAGADANLGLGCGNPVALAALRKGEVVVDLGSGAGFDALVAAANLGEDGRFIGVDMTPEMLELARKNAVKAGLARTVEFREGQIEDLPVASSSADVVISNCVINLSTDKAAVFKEAFRVLKPGGRLAVSDIVLSTPLPDDVTKLTAGWVACISGALTEEQYMGHIRAAGFTDVRWKRTSASALIDGALSDPLLSDAIKAIGEERVHHLAETVYSYSVEATKP